MLTSVMTARADSSSPSPSNDGLLLYFPDIPVELAQQTTQRLPTLYAGGAPRAITDPDIIDPIRQRLLPARRDAETTDPTLCGAGGPGVSSLLTRAARELDFLRNDRADLLLAQARVAFSCGAEVATPELLGNLQFLAGVTRVSGGQDAEDLFDEALAIWPDLPAPSVYDASVQAHFSQAQLRQVSRPRVTVQVQWARDAGLELRIDGLARPVGMLELPVGHHFLQLIASDGRAVAGTIVALTTSDDASVWPPAELRPPDVSELVRHLELQAGDGRLSPALASAVLRGTAQHPHSWILLVEPGSDPAMPHVGRLLEDGTLESLQLEPAQLEPAQLEPAQPEPPQLEPAQSEPSQPEPSKLRPSKLDAPMTGSSPPPEPRRRPARRGHPGLVVASGLGAVALGAGFYYAYAYDQLLEINAEQVHARERFVTLQQRGTVAGLAALVSLAGAAVSTGSALFSLSVGSPDAGLNPAQPALQLTVGAGPGTFWLQGAW